MSRRSISLMAWSCSSALICHSPSGNYEFWALETRRVLSGHVSNMRPVMILWGGGAGGLAATFDLALVLRLATSDTYRTRRRQSRTESNTQRHKREREKTNKQGRKKEVGDGPREMHVQCSWQSSVICYHGFFLNWMLQ